MRNIIIKIILVITLCLIYFIIEQKDDSGQTMTVDNFSIMIDDIDLLIEDKLTGIIYFGRDTCPNCLKFNVILNKVAQNINDLTIYKFDTDKWRSHNDFQEILDKYNVSDIPSLIYINDDKTYDVFEFTTDVEMELNSFISSNYINNR